MNAYIPIIRPRWMPIVYNDGTEIFFGNLRLGDGWRLVLPKGQIWFEKGWIQISIKIRFRKKFQ